MKKRIVSMFTAVMLAVSLIAVMPITVCAETSGDYEYNILDDGTVEITKYNGTETELKIPSRIDGKDVTSIGAHAFEWNMGITSVVLPASLRTIQSLGFRGCVDLMNITLPEGLTMIGDGAFRLCGLKEVSIPDSVTEIGESAFDGTDITDMKIGKGLESISRGNFDNCWYLQNITVDKENKTFLSENGILFNKDKTELVHYPQGRTDISFVVPESVKTIGDKAFYQCKNLTSIELPKSISKIGNEAFAQCVVLTNILIPKTVQIIGDYAFGNCTSLKKLIIPSSVTEIGYAAFGFIERGFDILIDEDFTVYCYRNTVGLEYAYKNGLYYEILELEPSATAELKYQLRPNDNGTTDVRFVLVADEDDVMNVASASVYASVPDDGDTEAVTIRKAYKSLIAGEKTITADEGKVFLIGKFVGIPEDMLNGITAHFTLGENTYDRTVNYNTAE